MVTRLTQMVAMTKVMKNIKDFSLNTSSLLTLETSIEKHLKCPLRTHLVTLTPTKKTQKNLSFLFFRVFVYLF